MGCYSDAKTRQIHHKIRKLDTLISISLVDTKPLKNIRVSQIQQHAESIIHLE